MYKRQIETRCDNIQKHTVEIVNEKFNTKISNLDTKIDQIYETVKDTVKNQIESQNTEIEKKCLTYVESQIEIKTNVEVSNHCLLYTSRCV